MSDREVWMSWDYDAEIPPSFSDVQVWESEAYAKEQLLLREGLDGLGRAVLWHLDEETGIQMLHINPAYAGIRLKRMEVQAPARSSAATSAMPAVVPCAHCQGEGVCVRPGCPECKWMRSQVIDSACGVCRGICTVQAPREEVNNDGEHA